MFTLKRRRPRHWATRIRPTTRCWTIMSRTNRRPTSPACWPNCAMRWCRWWRRLPTAADRPTPRSCRGIIPKDQQERFGSAVAAKIGFDFGRGRLDVTAHPFCTSLGPHDCRITTRFDEHFFPTALFGILHEAGHGIYDQGLRPSGTACRRAKRSRWGFTSRSRGCGKTWSRAACPSGSIFTARPSRRLGPWPTCRWNVFISRSTTCGRRSFESKPTKRRTTCTF